MSCSTCLQPISPWYCGYPKTGSWLHVPAYLNYYEYIIFIFLTKNFSQPTFVRKGLPIRWVMLKWNSNESGFWSWLDLFSWSLCLSLSLQWCLRDARLTILIPIMRPPQWAKIRKKCKICHKLARILKKLKKTT